MTGERGEGPRGCGPGPLHFSGKGDLGPGFFWADGDGGLGRTPTENWDPIPGGRDASDHSLPTPSGNPPLLKSQYHVWPLGCMSKAIGTGPGVPTHGHQHGRARLSHTIHQLKPPNAGCHYIVERLLRVLEFIMSIIYGLGTLTCISTAMIPTSSTTSLNDCQLSFWKEIKLV